MAPQQNTGTNAEAELPAYAGHYRLESCLGSGGMGVVHLARSTSGMKLAVKVVHAEFARDPEFRGRFRQEVGAARRVSGAFTAPVVDADPDAERPWMATLFIPGPTLAQEVKGNGPLPPSQLRRLMAGLAEALRDIHRVGVVHRDLKPSNVLLAGDGPKVIDFGISRPKDSELRTETGKLIGTPPFMAPEQFRRPREVGPAADVFALGSVMVHAATGSGPFDSDSPYVVAYQVVHDEPDMTGVPAELAPLVLRCLAKEPEDRPSPDELMRELRSVAASYDTQAFIPAQRTQEATDPGAGRPAEEPAGEPHADAPAASADDPAPSADGLGPSAGEPRPSGRGPGPRPRRRPGRRTAVGAGVLALVLVGGLAAVQSLVGTSTAPEDSPRTTAAAFSAWQTVPASEGSTPHCSHGQGTLFCAQPGTVFALDPADGRVLWRHTLPEDRHGGPPVLSGGLVQPPPTGERRLRGLDPSDGEPRWQQDVPAYTGLALAGNTLLLTAADGTVTGVDSASGDTRWSHRIAGHDLPLFTSFPGDPLAYLTSTSGDGSRTRLTAVDPVSGAVRWEARLTGSLEPLDAADGSVYLLAVDPVYRRATAVVRHTPETGATRRVELPVPLEQAQGGVRGDVVHLMGTGGSLVAVDLEAGKQLWNLETAVLRGSAPVADGRYVYVSAADGRLLAVDARSGRLRGQTPSRLGSASGRVAGSVPRPVLAQGHLYATAPDGTVFALDARDPSSW
ncbi:serine/threonine-protein kinase [Streptomyces sp. NPDC085946]|uniref:serine/threonine-protein kinase n=1 Tax=Streptomyces sp. NPDC085946 TaxID=3365744 RepID=UPI0037D4F395